MRYLIPFCAALLIAVGLFWLMQWLVTPPQGDVAERQREQPIVVARPPPEEQSQAAAQAALSEAPPAPPSVPSVSLSMNASMPLPASPSQSLAFSVPKIRTAGGSLSSGSFAGFTGGAGSGAGYGQGKGFKGDRLVPLSTSRPQIPRYAYEQGIEGWVEAAFFVEPNGRVSNIRIIDAQPRGVFEQAMIESIQNWIYASSKHTREVKQRFEFKLDDFQYNWN